MISKVCIVTNYRNTGNYGALLQAYALNRKIRDLGVECETLNFSAAEQNGSKWVRYYKRLKSFEFKSLATDLKRDVCKALVINKIKVRREALSRFRDSIPHTMFYSHNELKTIKGQYDCYICGSDQIWRPTFEGNLVGIYWLDVISGDCVKASYAASLGVSSLPGNVIDEVKQYLSSFDFISVREKSARDYLSVLTNKEIVVSIDPVFLIDRREWQKIAKRPDNHEPYIFVYMIHGSRDLLKSISDFAKDYNLKIITFPYMAYYFRANELTFGDIKIFDAEPTDFLGYINGATYVFTDSFHATAFSILFHKDFFVSSANEKAFSRIKNLLSIAGLNNNSVPPEGLSPEKYDTDRHVNWDDVDKRLETEISESIDYLNRVLKTEKM